jgi:hypothetical protein
MSGFSANSPSGGESPTVEEPHLLFIPDNNNTHGGESGESAVPAAAITTIGVSSIVPLLPGTALDLPTTPNNTYAKDPDKNDNDNNINDNDHDYDDNSDDDGKGGMTNIL